MIHWLVRLLLLSNYSISIIFAHCLSAEGDSVVRWHSSSINGYLHTKLVSRKFFLSSSPLQQIDWCGERENRSQIRKIKCHKPSLQFYIISCMSCCHVSSKWIHLVDQPEQQKFHWMSVQVSHLFAFQFFFTCAVNGHHEAIILIVWGNTTKKPIIIIVLPFQLVVPLHPPKIWI